MIFSMGLSFCTNNSNPDYFVTIKPKHPSDEVIINASTEPQYLDPTKVSDSTSRILTSSMFVRLTQLSPKTDEIGPDLAKSWDISEDGREYTFHIREDAVWSDGEPLTAHDVKYTWLRLADSATGSTYAQKADVFQNARAFREHAITIKGLNEKENIKSIEGKLEKISPVKDLYRDSKLGIVFAFIDSEDAQKKSELGTKLVNEINSGLLGSGVSASIADSSVVQIEVKDAHMLWVQLEKPVPYFLGLIEYMVFAPVPEHVIEKFKKDNKEDLWVRPENIVVSGPFILTEENFKQYKVYKKNPKYFNASKVRLNKVKALLVEDYQASVNAFKTGEHDWTAETSIPADSLEMLKKFKDFHFDPMLAVYYYYFNLNRKPLDDIRVRQAMSLAIDRAAIVKNVARQGQQPSRDLVPDGIMGYVGPRSSLYDPELAKKLLAEAGFPNGKDFPKLLLKFNTSDGHRKIAEAVQAMWKEVLGIQVDIANMEWRSLLQDQDQGNFDIVRYSWTADYVDPHTFLSIMLSESKNNKSSWKNKKYDQLIMASDTEKDQKKRFEMFSEAEKILTEESPIIPFYFYTRAYLKKPFLKGFWPDYLDRHEWKYMWIDERWNKGVPESDIADEPWAE